MSLVDLANEKVSIVAACAMVGVDLIEDVGYTRSRKVHCPFGGVYHSDGGVEPAMRVYPDTNSAWCFRCSAYYTPVKLCAQAWDQDWPTAAGVLLDRIGYRPMTVLDRWAQAVHAAAPDVDRDQLAEALKLFCVRVDPTFAVRQFTGPTAAALGSCLALLDRVHTDEDARTWLAGVKQVMHRHLLG